MKELVHLVLCIAMFTMDPLLATDELKSDPSQPLSIVHTCSVCTRSAWAIDPDDKVSNGVFNPVPDPVMLQVIARLPTQDIFLMTLVSKKMCNIMNIPELWIAMDQCNKIHLSKAPCPKYRFLENHQNYFGLFKIWKDEMRLQTPETKIFVNKSTILFFMEKPFESTWCPKPHFPDRKETDQSYSVSIGMRQFEFFVYGDKQESLIEDAKKDPLGEFVLWCFRYSTSTLTRETGQGFISAFSSPTEVTCFIRELPPIMPNYAIFNGKTWKIDANDVECLNLFKEWGDDISYMVKNNIVLSFMEQPYETDWHHPFMIYKDKAMFYTFSLGQRQFEVYIANYGGKAPMWLKDAEENPEGETKFICTPYNTFLAGSPSTPTCLIREKPINITQGL